MGNPPFCLHNNHRLDNGNTAEVHENTRPLFAGFHASAVKLQSVITGLVSGHCWQFVSLHPNNLFIGKMQKIEDTAATPCCCQQQQKAAFTETCYQHAHE